ncbi:penicillin-binding protein H [Oceanobacillus picturae]|uniref:serine-type D-Ala-D-Ala carboxypeptidase n=1 Tax=Oceanobacillus picturae TaxID=171693 RepID=A0A0U9H9C1_9BACI|nr:penicillin-binding protein 2 [Oceanobacillus picturae]RIU93537.1 penicillin-binding protein 2 [Oceanobacillus picturae]GAQ19287.1 penicillin-binding protein H [Oceanobacillus picturae]
MGNKKRKKKAQLPFRINILFFVVFLMFSVLIMQLGVVQILNGEAFQEEIDRTIQDTTKIPVPRGKIYDANHNVVVDNKPLYSITYTPAKGTQAEDRLKVAKKLATFISMDSEDYLDGITERNIQEYIYLQDIEKAEDRVTAEERKELSNSDFYKLVLERIPEEDIDQDKFSKQELEVIAIKKELDKAYSLTPQIVKNEDVTAKEYAQVAEHLSELPGINATTDWDREYPYKDTFKGLLGSITSQEQGIPAESEAYYMTRGYSRNDRVGKSGLEEYYEESLRGRKEQIQYTTTKSGRVIDSKTIVEGERGKDLVLTVDMEFQEEVDKIVREELKAAKEEHPYANRTLEDAIAVVMNPKTGEILAASGQAYVDGEYQNAELRTLYNANLPGSTVKGATVLAGLQSGVITPGQYFYDRPIKIGTLKPKGSYSELGSVNDLLALQKSSNVYMFYIALKMGGENRYPFPNGSKASFDSSAWQQMRNYFQQFGLGVKTGIDYPYESVGYVGESGNSPGLLMDYAIGQYDSFTAMQMAQYVSTIANDGYRVRPHFLKEIREPGTSEEQLGSVYRTENTEVLNKIEMDQSYIDRVQQGFRLVATVGTASELANKDYMPAAKTGTAESSVKDENGNLVYTENLSLVGYAPYDDPEVAFAVIAPNTGTSEYRIQHNMASRILDAYFDMKDGNEEEEN